MTHLDKAQLRAEARARRTRLAAEFLDFAQRIARFANEIDIVDGAVIAGYWPVRGEADPRALMAALELRGAILTLPRIDARNTALSFRHWRDGDALFDNHHGIAEPGADAETLIPSVVLVPLLAFDIEGHRLGYGGGYYDRTLDALRASHAVRAIGIAYAEQEVPQLPRESHDHGLDAVITEHGLRCFPASRV